MSSYNKLRNYSIWSVYISFAFVFFGFVITIAYSFITKKITFYEYFIVYGDSASALFSGITFFVLLLQIISTWKEHENLLAEAEKDRKTLIQENQKERHRAWLKDRINFYSKMYIPCDKILTEVKPSNKLPNMEEIMNNSEIRLNFPLYSSKELDKHLSYYYDNFNRKNFEEINKELGIEDAKNHSQNVIDKICLTVIEDYERISEKYRELNKQIY